MMINGAHSGGRSMETSVLEKQRAVLQWHHHHLHFPQQQQAYFGDFQGVDSMPDELLTSRQIKPDPGFDGMLDSGTSRTASSTQAHHKRKVGYNTLVPPMAEAESRANKLKRSGEEEEIVPKRAYQNHNSSTKNSNNRNKESNSKEGSEGQKQDYIHVRARRGQATDSHSLAERVRREKISERMKYLQELVPGCCNITGKAGMLDEIINYVQSLQRQVEFLSMKLASANPTLDFNIEDFFAKEVSQACLSNFPGSGITSEMANLAYLQRLQYNQEQQMGPISASDLGMSEVQMGLQPIISAPASNPMTFLDSSCLTQQIETYLPWDQSDAQSIYNMNFQQARQQPFPSQTDTGANWKQAI